MTHDPRPAEDRPPMRTAQPPMAGAGRTHGGIIQAVAPALADPLARASTIVQDLVQSGKITRMALHQLGDALADARRVAAQVEELAALEVAGPAGDAEPLRLDMQVSQALARQMPELRRHQVRLQPQDAQSAWVVANPQWLARLLDAAIAWCTRTQHDLAILIEASGDMGTVLLRLRLLAGDAPAAPAPTHLALTWHSLQALARTSGVRVHWQETGTGGTLTLALERHMDTATESHPGDLVTSHDSLLTSAAVPLAHQRVLLITRHDEVRTEVEHVCASLGAVLDWVATGAAAMRQFAQARADIVLADARSSDASVVRLQQQLRQEAPDFPWITLAAEPRNAALTHWSDDGTMRLSNLRSELASTLLFGPPQTRAR